MQVWPLFFDQYLLKDVNLKIEIKKLYIFKQKIYILYIYIQNLYIFKQNIWIFNETLQESKHNNYNIIQWFEASKYFTKLTLHDLWLFF